MRKFQPIIAGQRLLAGGLLFSTIIGAVVTAHAQDDPAVAEVPVPAEEPRFQVEDYIRQLEALQKFKNDHPEALKTIEAADRWMTVLTRLIQDEAAEKLRIALDQDDTTERDRQLKDLAESTNYIGTPAADEAQRLLDARTVDGKLRPTREAAEQARQALEDQTDAEQEKRETAARKKLEQLADDLLSGDIEAAVRQEREEMAWERLEAARRLVPAQRHCRLEEIVAQFPGTRAAMVATEIITSDRQRRERLAAIKLDLANCAPLVFDQRWRRLKELTIHFPGTAAAAEAEMLLLAHAAEVPPLTLVNQSAETVEVSIETLYDGETFDRLKAGEVRIVPSMFPALVRVKMEDELIPLRVKAGDRVLLEPGPRIHAAN